MYKNSLRLRLLSGILSALILLCGATAVGGLFSVSAAETESKLSSAYTNSFEYGKSEASFSQDVCDYLSAGFRSFKTRIDLSSYKIQISDMTDLFLKVLFDNPDIFYVNPSTYSYSSNSNSQIVAFVPKYIFSTSEIPSLENKFEDACNNMTADINPGWSDSVKAMVLHDNLALNCQYASDEYEADGGKSAPEIFNAYGALVNGRAVCQGYALAYNYLLSKVGIKASMVVSNSMNHAWSLVEINGKYYHTDTTWDDPTYDILGNVSHKFLLKSDDAMLNSSYRSHYDWIAAASADSTDFDDYFWDNINTKIYYADGKYYYISNLSENSDKGNILVFDGTDKKSLLSIPEVWYANSQHTSYWVNKFARISVCGNSIYYNTSDTIYSVNIDGTNKKAVYALSANEAEKGSIYGMMLDKDGYFCISQSDTPNNKMSNYKISAMHIYTKTNTLGLNGDVDGNGEISIIDATVLQMYIAKLSSLNDMQISFSDTDADGSVNITDATAIQTICAKLQ